MTEHKMQITDDGTAYDHASKFEFPENPFTFNLPIEMDRKVTNVDFNSYHVFSTGGGIKTRSLIFNGTFHGSTRRTNYNSLAGKMISTDIQRFWLDSDTFFNFYCGRVVEVLNNEKNNFIDYNGTLMMTDPFIYKTARTLTKNTTVATEVTTAAFTNNGNADSIPKIEITNNSSANITQVEIGDGATLSASFHKITWSGGTIASGEKLTIYSYKMLNQSGKGDIKSTRIGYSEKSSALYGSMSQNGTGSQPRITGGTTAQVFSIKLTGCNASTDVKFSWYDAYTG